MSRRSWGLLGAAAMLVAGSLTAPAATAAQHQAAGTTGSLRVGVHGLPKRATSRVTVIGPTGSADTHTWKIGRGKTLKGLTAGLYVISSPSHRTKAGTLYQPKTPNAWVKVRPGQRTTSIITYSRASAGNARPTGRKEQINMPLACYYLNGGPKNWAKAYFRSPDDPYSWYCLLQNGQQVGMDLDRYCKSSNKGWMYWESQLLGKSNYDWYCVQYTLD